MYIMQVNAFCEMSCACTDLASTAIELFIFFMNMKLIFNM